MATNNVSGATPAATAPAKKGLWGWINKRLPVDEFIAEQLTGYYAPKNFNIWYFFGSLALVVLVLQLVTGIFLTMFYKPGELTSFDSVEYIMREVNFGWLIRYLHSTGASAFFIVVYLHMFRALPVRLVQDAARAAVDRRHARVPRAHGRGLHGLRAALGQHVVLGRAGDREPVRHHSRPIGPAAWSSGSAATTASPMPP